MIYLDLKYKINVLNFDTFLLRHGVSTEEHNRVRSELRDMKRKLSQFQRCISEEQKTRVSLY